MLSRAFWSGLAIAGFVAAQGDIAALLSTQPDLSQLLHAVGTVPGLAAKLSAASNITIFAPIDTAFDELIQEDSPEASAVRDRNSTTVEALLVRHVFSGYYTSDLITDTPAWIGSRLTPEYRNAVQPFANTTGGLQAGVVLNGEDVNVITGELTVSRVTQADIRLGDGIVIHKVDKVLTFSPPVTLYAARSGNNFFQGAVDTAGLSNALDIGVPDLTIFVPVNAAFEAIGSVVSSVDQATLISVLQYHAIPDTIAYSTTLGNVTVPTLNGNELTISVTPNGEIFVNQAKVIFPNVLLPNGVAHLIDVVLNPGNAPFDRATLDEVATLPAASRTAYPNATPSPTLAFTVSNAPIATDAFDPIGDFTVSTDFFYTTPALLSTLNVLPRTSATATPTAGVGAGASQTTSGAAQFTGAAVPERQAAGVAVGLVAVACAAMLA